MKLSISKEAVTLFLVILVSMNFTLSVSAQNTDQALAITNSLRDAVVHLKVVMDYGDGRQEILNQVTGVLVGDHGFVLTSKHLFDKITEPELRKTMGVKKNSGVSVLIRAIQGSHEGTEYSLNYVDESNNLDFSLLQFSRSLPPRKWPCFRVGSPLDAQENTEIVTLGFSGGKYTSTIGRIASLDGLENTYKMDTAVSSGGSGAPVIDIESQELLGLVRGKQGQTDFNLFTPINLALGLLKPAGECQREITPIFVIVVVVTAEQTVNEEQQFQVDETNDDHASSFNSSRKCYERIFQAKPGNQIVNIAWAPASVTRESDLNFNTLDGGQRAFMRFCLTAGPKVDRYRGWIHGILKTTEVRVVPSSRREVGKFRIDKAGQIDIPPTTLVESDRIILLGQNGEVVGAGLARDKIGIAGTCLRLQFENASTKATVTCQ
jgi:Trypsin-like peptidase domain